MGRKETAAILEAPLECQGQARGRIRATELRRRSSEEHGQPVGVTTQHVGAVSRETPQLPVPWPEVCKHREGLGLRELEAQRGRGSSMANFRSFSEI